MTLPMIAIIGRPNVGKSTLFNFLTQTRSALVVDVPGVTRDRQYGMGRVGGRAYYVIDTGGLAEPDDPIMAQLTDWQVNQAIEEADILLFMVEAQAGRVSADEVIAQRLRPLRDKVVLVVNKADRENASVMASDFFALGLGEPHIIAAKGGRGVAALMEDVLSRCPEESETEEAIEGAKVAVLGRPNVGKSTLINRILGEERVVVLDRPGTTRDSIFIPFERRGKHYTLIDTAGVRRRSKVTDAVEKFSVIKALQAIQIAQVMLVVLNAREGLLDQDLRLIGYVLEAGKGLIIVVNQWDDLDDYAKSQFKQAFERRLPYVDFARRYFISALHGTGVGKLYHAIDEAYESATRTFNTSLLTRTLEAAVKAHQPPLVGGRRIRLRFAHMGSQDPLTIVIRGKQTDAVPGAYQRYLANFFREHFQLVGVPLRLEFENDPNPYVDAE